MASLPQLNGDERKKGDVKLESLIDLHVFIVPVELWLDKYHKARNAAVLESVSAGFVRAPATSTLSHLREFISLQLGFGIIPEHYVFLKSVGRFLAVVNRTQEATMTAADFTHPTAHSELLLLPSALEMETSLKKLDLSRQFVHTPNDATASFDTGKTLLPTSADAVDERNYVHFSEVPAIPPILPLSSEILNMVSSDSDSGTEPTPVPYEEEVESRDILSGSNASDEGSRSHMDEGLDTHIDARSRGSSNLTFENVELQEDEEEVMSLRERIMQRIEKENERLRGESRIMSAEIESASLANMKLFESVNDIGESIARAEEDNRSELHDNIELESVKTEVSPVAVIEDSRPVLSLDNSPPPVLPVDNSPPVLAVDNQQPEPFVDNAQHAVSVDASLQIADDDALSVNEETSKIDSNEGELKIDGDLVIASETVDQISDVVQADVAETSVNDLTTVEGDTNNNKTSDEKQEEERPKKAKKKKKKRKKQEKPDDDTQTENVTAKDKDDEQQRVEEEELAASKQREMEELKRQLEAVNAEKNMYAQSKDTLAKRKQELVDEMKENEIIENETWKRKYLGEKAKTTNLEEEIQKLKKVIESQYQKSIPLPNGKGIVKLNKDGVHTKIAPPSEKSNQRNLVLKLQNEINELDIRHEIIKKQLVEESTMKSFAEQELKELRFKSLRTPRGTPSKTQANGENDTSLLNGGNKTQVNEESDSSLSNGGKV